MTTPTNMMKWPLPAEDQDPWYEDFVTLWSQADASGYAAREDRNIFLAGGGTFTFNAGTGITTWDAPLEILSPASGVILTLAAATITIVEGEFVWVDLVRMPQSGTTLALVKGGTVPSSDSAFLLAVRRGNRVYFRGAKVINSGESLVLYQQAPSGGGLSNLTNGRILIGDASNLPQERAVSGDAVLSNLGALTIANSAITTAKIAPDAVTAAKLLKSETYDFATALGVLRVQDPVAATDAANRQWVLANIPTIPARNAGLTVWVARNHTQSTDVRTGIPYNSEDRPFATIAAAFAAITLAGAFNVEVVILAGYYDEAATVPDSVTIVCQSDAVFITRLVFSSGGQNAMYGGRMFNSASFGSAAPNLAPIEVSNGTQLRMYNVRCEDYETDTDLAVDPTLKITNGAVSTYGCQFAHYHLQGGAGLGESHVCARVTGTTSTLLSEQSTFFMASDVSGDNLNAVQMETTGAASAMRLLNCLIGTAALHPSATCRIRCLTVLTAVAPALVEMIGGAIWFQSGLAASPSEQLLVRCEATGLAQDVTLTGVTVRKISAAAANRYAAIAQDVANTVRLLGMLWPTEATQFASDGNVFHTGSTQDGTHFPMRRRELALGGPFETDGAVGGEEATEAIVSLLPSNWGAYPTRTFKFCAVLYTTNVAKTMTARLVNLSNGQTIAALSTTSTAAVYLETTLTVGTNPTDLQVARTEYELRMQLTAGVFADKGKLSRAWVEVS